VPVSVEPEDVGPPSDAGRGVITIEIGNDLVLRVPGDVPPERAAAAARKRKEHSNVLTPA
jgi:transposase